MVSTITLRQQCKQTQFNADYSNVLYFGQNLFDKVFKRRKGRVEQAYPNLKECKNDCRRMRRTLRRFKVGLRKKYNFYFPK